MSRAKILVATCMASLTLLVVGSASASAAEWFVGKAPLGSGEPAALATGTTTVKAFELVIVGSGLSINCTGLQNSEASIVGTASFEGKALTFTGCSSNAPACPVTPTISTKEVSGSAALGAKSPESTLTIKPKTGENLMTLKFTGSRCAISALPVKGQFTMTLPEGQTEQSEHELVVSSTELKTAGNTDTLTGAVKDKLASGSEWSFH
jgi:hypothetical protein